MTVSERDIFRAAKLLVDRHGEDAPIEAAMRADELGEKGDLAGQMTWIKIKAAIETLLSTVPSETLH